MGNREKEIFFFSWPRRSCAKLNEFEDAVQINVVQSRKKETRSWSGQFCVNSSRRLRRRAAHLT